jgi:hypothetical protein
MARTQVALIACASAAAIAVMAAWILWDAPGTEKSKAFISTPQFLLWLLLLCAQAVVWVLGFFMAGAIVRGRFRALHAAGAISARLAAQIVAAAVVLLALAAISVSNVGHRIGIPKEIARSGLGDPRSPLTHQSVKLPPVVVVGVLVGLLAIGGMWLVSLAFERLGTKAPLRAGSINRFVDLRNELNTLLAIAGAIVGLGALATGALREAVLAANDEPYYRDRAVACLTGYVDAPPVKRREEVLRNFDDLSKAHPECIELVFAREYVLEYGLFFTGLLAIAYAPSFLAVRRAGVRVRDKAYPMLAPGDAKFFDRLEERRRLDEFLQTNLSANANFKAGVAILTPLAGSVVSLLLPT